MEPVLRAEDLGVGYGEQDVLENISFQVYAGDFLSVIGPNGSGKTTLLRALSGAIRARTGNVMYKGIPVRDYSRKQLAKSMAFVAQEYAFTHPMTVKEVVLMGRYPHLSRLSFEGPHDLEVARQAMRFTDTEHLGDRRFQELSGGERQRVIIARALAQEPEIVLFDEPTAFLDIGHQVDFFDLIWDLNRNRGLTIVAVSHDINLAAQYSGRMLLMQKGRVYRLGTVSEVVTEDAMRAVYGKQVLLDLNPVTGSPRITLLGRNQGAESGAVVEHRVMPENT